MSGSCPIITCRITDEYGNEINPYSPNANLYSQPQKLLDNHWSIGIEGYIAVFSDEERISPPIPFCINTYFTLYVPKGCSISVVLQNYRTWAVPIKKKCQASIGKIKIHLSFETLISSEKAVCLLVPKVDDILKVVDHVYIHTNQIYDSIVLKSDCCISYKNAKMQAEISQYNTIGDGIKRTFYNDDELKEYGDQGILAPDDVSYANVFVNGILQPKQNYILKKGELTFTTQSVPAARHCVIILFITWKDKDYNLMQAFHWQYSAISNGVKKIYLNSDEVPGYESHGIPAPNEVSYFNLYINGVLQPKGNYCVRKGVLKLCTHNAPTKGSYVLLESVIIYDQDGHLFRAEPSSFNAYSNGGRIYTDKDSIYKYDLCGILGPCDSSYQSLYINGILQPQVNYIVKRGCLILKTVDCPTKEAPIALQSVSSSPAIPYCKLHFSEKAFEYLKDLLTDVDEIEQSLLSSETFNELNLNEE